MEDLTITLTPAMLALVPVVAAILQMLKKLEPIQKIKSYLPFISVGVACGLCFFAKIQEPIMASIIIGLVASGGFDMLRGTTK